MCCSANEPRCLYPQHALLLLRLLFLLQYVLLHSRMHLLQAPQHWRLQARTVALHTYMQQRTCNTCMPEMQNTATERQR